MQRNRILFIVLTLVLLCSLIVAWYWWRGAFDTSYQQELEAVRTCQRVEILSLNKVTLTTPAEKELLYQVLASSAPGEVMHKGEVTHEIRCFNSSNTVIANFSLLDVNNRSFFEERSLFLLSESSRRLNYREVKDYLSKLKANEIEPK